MRKAATTSNGSLLSSIELFDEYRGEHVPAGQRSLAFRLVYRADDRTLTDDEVNPVHQKVRDALEDRFRVSLRS
jgi:phenylalanyl-tRNA synthetase beta chain